MKYDTKRYLGLKVKHNRIRLELSQLELGQVLDLGRASIINIEQGRHSPTIEGLMILCSVFGCQPNDLLPKASKITLESKEKTIVIKRKVKTYTAAKKLNN